MATKEFVRRLGRSASPNLISDLVRTSFAPRSTQQLKTQLRQVFERFSNGKRGLGDSWVGQRREGRGDRRAAVLLLLVLAFEVRERLNGMAGCSMSGLR